MKKFLLIAAAACVGLASQSTAQTALTQDFESTSVGSIPSGWTKTGGWKTGNGGLNLYWLLPAHTNYGIVNDYSTGASTGTSDLKSPVFRLDSVAGASLSGATVLVYDYWFIGAHLTSGVTTPEAAFVKISDDSGLTWTVIDTIPPASANPGTAAPWLTRSISLAGHTSSNTLIEFEYNDHGAAIIGFAVDNIFAGVLPSADIALLSTSFSNPFYPENYGKVSTALSYTGTVQNKGLNTISSFKVFSQIDTNAIDSAVISASVPSLGTYTFTSAINLPANAGSWNTKIWVVVDSDANLNNDSTVVGIGAYANNPTKRLSFEEGTGTWCGWCIRGIVFMDSLRKLYGEDGPSLIAVHNSSSDPMTVTAYDNYMTSHYYASFPNVAVDRREIHDPSELLDVQTSENNIFSFADVKIATPVISGSSMSSQITITPAINLIGDYRLVLVVTEDGVHDSGVSGYDQHNYYSIAWNNANGYTPPGAMQGWENLANPVTSMYMYFDHVARSINPSVTGTAGVLPDSMIAGQAYTATINSTLSNNWSRNKLRTVVLLIRNSDGIVLNSASTTYWPVNVATVAAGIDHITMYPNPAQNYTTIQMTLSQPTKVNITVIDQLGRTVSTVANQTMAGGTQSVKVNTSSLASGVYNVRIETAKGAITQRLSVVNN